MNRRSFLASVVAGLVAPFLPKVEKEPEELWQVDDCIGDVQVEDSCLTYEFDGLSNLDSDWQGSVMRMYLPDPEHPGQFLICPPISHENDTCIDWGTERDTSVSVIADWVETLDQCDCDIDIRAQEECEDESEVVDYLFTSDPGCPGETRVFQVRKDGKVKPW